MNQFFTKQMKRTKNTKGFTLIELIVVIAILGILALVAVPRFAKVQTNAKIDSDMATASSIVNAAKIHIATNNIKSTDFGTISTTALSTAGLLEQATYNAQTNGTTMVLTVAGSDAAPTFTVKAGDTNQLLPLSAEGKGTGVFVK